MGINDLINNEIMYVAKYEDQYYVRLKQTDHGDDSVYWVKPDKTVEYDSAIRLLGEEWFDESKLQQISVDEFKKAIN